MTYYGVGDLLAYTGFTGRHQFEQSWMASLFRPWHVDGIEHGVGVYEYYDTILH